MKISNRQIIRLVSLGVLIIAGGILCIIRWDAWFGNLPEQPYVPSAVPHNIVINYGEQAANQRVITWCADTVAHKSRLRLVTPAGDTSFVVPSDTLIYSRAGKAVYYKAELNNLNVGTYRYSIAAEDTATGWHKFEIKPFHSANFVIIGDVQDEPGGSSADIFRAIDSLNPNADCWAFVGDIIERPTDAYWQYWFSTMDSVNYTKPIIAATGNHEYLKGVVKHLDTRWTSIFANPLNGPHRLKRTSYYIDFPHIRYIVIDTDGINSFSDYTIASAWLRRVTSVNSKKWNILMMHHPIHSASQGRENVILNLILRHSIDNTDVIIQGHDHNYARRFSRSDTIPVTPVFVVTSTAGKYYLPKVNPADDRILSGHPVYNTMRINGDTLTFRTFAAEDNTLYDQFTIVKNDTSTTIIDQTPDVPEIIDLPDRYKNKENAKIRRFRNRRDARINEK